MGGGVLEQHNRARRAGIANARPRLAGSSTARAITIPGESARGDGFQISHCSLGEHCGSKEWIPPKKRSSFENSGRHAAGADGGGRGYWEADRPQRRAGQVVSAEPVVIIEPDAISSADCPCLLHRFRCGPGARSISRLCKSWMGRSWSSIPLPLASHSMVARRRRRPLIRWASLGLGRLSP